MVNTFKNIKRLKLKIASIIMLVVLLTLEFSPLAVKAANNQLQFYCPGSIIVGYDNFNRRNVWYGNTTLGGITAYCVDYAFHAPSGVMTQKGHVPDRALAVLIQGYPNCSPESLGCQSTDEAFMATQMAIWEVLERSDISKKSNYPFRVENITPVAGKEAFYNRAIAGARKLLAIADANPYNFSPVFNIDNSVDHVKTQDIENDDVLIGPYTLTVTGIQDIASVKNISARLEGQPNSARLTDANGNPLGAIANGGSVYVRMSRFERATNFRIVFSADIDRKYGTIYTSADSSTQDYVILDTVPESASGSVQINWHNDNTFGEFEIVKVDEEDKPLAGAKFRIEDDKGNVMVDSVETGSDGKIIYSNVKEGNYVAIEIEAPAGYKIKNKSTNITVKANERTSVKIVNETEKTSLGKLIVIKKDDENKPIQGVKFNVYDSNDNFIIQITTDENGQAGVKNLKMGDYYCKEVEAPEQYKMDPTPQSFKLQKDGEVITLNFVNEKIKGSLKITKVDDTDKPIKDVKFQILDENKQVVEELVTDANGVAVSKELVPGTYYYKEVEAPFGYVLDSTEHKFEIDNSGTMVSKKVVNDTAKGKLVINKYDNTGKTLEGVKFNILDESDNVVATIVTDKDGHAETESLPLGTYYYQEVEAPSNVVMDTQKHKFSLTENNQIITKTVINDICEGKLKIIKLVEGKETPLAGVKFDILDADKNVIQTIVTDENGQAMSDSLPYGKYYFKEVDAPDGYIMDVDEHEFTIEKNGDLIEAVVYNAEERLPKTGGFLSDDMIIILAISIVSILGYSFIRLISEKKENY